MPFDLIHRPRRLRMNARIRDMVRENHVRLDDLIYPMFVTEDLGAQNPITSMPGCFQYGVDRIGEELQTHPRPGIPAEILLATPKKKTKRLASLPRSRSPSPRNRIDQEGLFLPRRYHDICLCEIHQHGNAGSGWRNPSSTTRPFKLARRSGRSRRRDRHGGSFPT
jgi:porphobilinogen synthase